MDIKMYTHVMSAVETTKDDSSVETIDYDSRRYDCFTGQLHDRTKYIGRKKELDQLESFGVIRRVKQSEATHGKHVRTKIIAHNKGDPLEPCQYGHSIRKSRRVCSNQSQSHRTLASQDRRNLGRWRLHSFAQTWMT